jgi:hypothetical protein
MADVCFKEHVYSQTAKLYHMPQDTQGWSALSYGGTDTQEKG